jgi:hypothetical protein
MRARSSAAHRAVRVHLHSAHREVPDFGRLPPELHLRAQRLDRRLTVEHRVDADLERALRGEIAIDLE